MAKPNIPRIRCSKKPNNYTETWAQRTQRPQNPLSMAEVEPYWKSLWAEKAQYNESAEWIRREERRNISNLDWGPTESVEIT